MDDMMYAIQEYWLSQKEAKIYLSMLKMWSAPVSSIARHVEEKRTSIYSIVEWLLDKGVVSVTTVDNTQYFSAVDPVILLEQLEKKYLYFKEKVPYLSELINNTSYHPKVQYYHGEKWLATLFALFSTTSVDMKVILTTQRTPEQESLLLSLANHYRSKRKKSWLISRRIVSQSHYVNIKEEKEDDKKYGRETMVVKKIPLDIQADINIFWPNYVSFMFFEWAVPHIILIESELLYHTISSFFDYVRQNESVD